MELSSVPYVVVDKMPNLPVYKVKPEHGRGVKTIHCDQSPSDALAEKARKHSNLDKGHKKMLKEPQNHLPELTESSESESVRFNVPYQAYMHKLLESRMTRDRSPDDTADEQEAHGTDQEKSDQAKEELMVCSVDEPSALRFMLVSEVDDSRKTSELT